MHDNEIYVRMINLEPSVPLSLSLITCSSLKLKRAFAIDGRRRDGPSRA